MMDENFVLLFTALNNKSNFAIVHSKMRHIFSAYQHFFLASAYNVAHRQMIMCAESFVKYRKIVFIRLYIAPRHILRDACRF